MSEYQTFANEALELYKSLPEETNSIYKRRHIVLDLSLLEEKSDLIDDKTIIERIYKESIAHLNISFDVIIGRHGAIVKDNPYIKTINKNDEEFYKVLKKSMHDKREDKYVAFTHAHVDQIITINIPEGVVASLNVLFVNAYESLPIIVYTKLGKNANLKMLQVSTSKSSKNTFTSIINEFEASEYSKAEVNIIYPQNEYVTIINNSKADAAAGAEIKFNYIYIGGSAIRSRNYINAVGNSSSINANEIIFGSKSQKMDINTYIINTGRETTAKLDSKVALMHDSICFIKGFAKIVNGAKESRSFVEEGGILIDRTARIDSIPSVSIDENAVKATHSSATGPIDDESLFYLTSRGIDKIRAQQLILSGFFSPVISNISDDNVKSIISSMINDKMKNNGRYGIIPKVDTTDIIWFSKPSADLFERHYKYRGN